METGKVCLALVGALVLVFAACSPTTEKTLTDVNNVLKEPTHINTSTEPHGSARSSPTPAPAPSK